MKFKIFQDPNGIFMAFDDNGKYIASALKEQDMPQAIRARLRGNLFISEIEVDAEENKNG